MITVNTKSPGVDIPLFLREKELVEFILGRDPTPRLQADANGILVGMRFGGKPYTCYFPWAAIGRMECPASVIQFRPQADTKQTVMGPEGAAAGPEKDKRPNLRVVK
jgi:stringent starvation protein B